MQIPTWLSLAVIGAIFLAFILAIVIADTRAKKRGGRPSKGDNRKPFWDGYWDSGKHSEVINDWSSHEN